jgi:hypothetical protein
MMSANHHDSLTDKCIYLDLDQTLISTADEKYGLDYLYKLKILSNPSLMHIRKRVYHVVVEDLEKPGYGSKYEMWGITRPNLHRFLTFCFSYFRLVMVYSAGKRQYVESIVDHIFKDLPYPHLVLSYDDIEKDKKGNVIKPLTVVMNANSLTKQYVKPTNTLGLDDLKSTYSENKGNGILIPAYEPELNEQSLSENDDCLIRLENWLMLPEVINCKDIRTLNKDKIFS